MSSLFQDRNTGKLVEFISKHDKDYAMIRDAGGNIAYVNIDHLVPYDREKGRLAKVEVRKFSLSLKKHCLKLWYQLKTPV